MLELFIKRNETQADIALVEDGNLIEYYEEKEDDIRNEGNIYIGVVKDIIEGMQSTFVDIGTEKNSFIHLEDILPKYDEKKSENIAKTNNKENIKNIIKKGQKILVQVKKDSNDKKGARISTHINLPSKYIVLMPDTDIITISQKIENKEEQERLINLVRNNLSKNNGAIIRTSAQGKSEELIQDIKYIENKWSEIQKEASKENNKLPRIIYKGEDIVEKMFIDLTEKQIEKVYVNDSQDYNELIKLKDKINNYANIKIQVKGENTIFDIYDLNKQIKKLQNRKLWLKCGGFITIDKTEALTAIDVNTGKYTGNENLRDTIFRVNKEATIEIAKQLRLRDIGGIIIIDYIDMKNKEDREKIEELLKEELKKDRSKTQVEGFTKLELMELTRKHICSHKS